MPQCLTEGTYSTVIYKLHTPAEWLGGWILFAKTKNGPRQKKDTFGFLF